LQLNKSELSSYWLTCAFMFQSRKRTTFPKPGFFSVGNSPYTGVVYSMTTQRSLAISMHSQRFSIFLLVFPWSYPPQFLHF